jgi:hypothetical protein
VAILEHLIDAGRSRAITVNMWAAEARSVHPVWFLDVSNGSPQDGAPKRDVNVSFEKTP